MRKKIKWTAVALTIILIGVVGYYGYSFIKFGMDIHTKPEESRFKKFYEDDQVQPVYQSPVWEGKERVNILLLGGDSRGLGRNEAPRSDTLMVASLDPQTKTAALFSILRDTYVDIPGHGKDRINAALAIGGPELSMRTVSDLLGIPIQYYYYADFEGFIELIDAIGGIDFYVEKDMKYTDITDKEEYNIDLKQGMQHLDGNKALQYVRFRHDAMSDYSRTERQRSFLKAVAAKMQSTSSLIKLPGILSEVSPYIETNMNLNQMLRLGTLGFSIDTGSVAGIQLPPSDLLREERVRGADVITVDAGRLQAFIAEELAKSLQPDIPGVSGPSADGPAAGGSSTDRAGTDDAETDDL